MRVAVVVNMYGGLSYKVVAQSVVYGLRLNGVDAKYVEVPFNYGMSRQFNWRDFDTAIFVDVPRPMIVSEAGAISEGGVFTMIYGITEGRLSHDYSNVAAPNAVIAISRYAYEMLKMSGVPNVVGYIHHMLPPDVYEYKPDFEDKGNYLLYYGGSWWRKAIDEIVAAWIRLWLTEPVSRKYRLFIVSNSVPNNMNLSISDLRSFGIYKLGYPMPRMALLRLISKARAVLLPSRSEGFGLPLIEAPALGTPVITLDCPPMNEVDISSIIHIPARCFGGNETNVIEGPDIYFRPHIFDRRDLSQAIFDIITMDYDELLNIARRGIEEARDKYNPKNYSLFLSYLH
jgi:glycosyltransferase involved in cell wall biosynthesis